MASAKKQSYKEAFLQWDLLALLTIQLQSLKPFFAVKYLVWRVWNPAN
jgi:hypothetical protein